MALLPEPEWRVTPVTDLSASALATISNTVVVDGVGDPLLIADDYLCPACERFMKAHDPATDPPLRLLHVPAHEGSAEINRLSLCLDREGVYDEHANRLYGGDPTTLTAEFVDLYPALDTCLTSPTTEAQLKAEFELLKGWDIRSTPTLYRVE